MSKRCSIDDALKSAAPVQMQGDSSKRRQLVVSRLWHETPNVLGVELRAPDGAPLPAFEAGAHINLLLPNGLARQYSLANDPNDRDRYQLGILKEPNGRGGSSWIHENLKVDGVVDILSPQNHFPVPKGAERYLLIAGGIGITPLLAMIETFRHGNLPFRLFYCTRGPEDVAFRARLSSPEIADNVTFVHDGGDPAKGLNLKALLAEHEAGTHICCCGPAGLMSAVQSASSHWPSGTVHFEWFAADQGASKRVAENKAFTVRIARTGQDIVVPADMSLLDVLSEHGFDIESVCREGVCGTCIVDVKEGEIDHRDFVLDESERAANDCMAVCCSRAKSELLLLDL